MWGAAPRSYRATLLLALAFFCACPVAHAGSHAPRSAPPKRLAVVTRNATSVVVSWRAPAGSRPPRFVVKLNGRIVATTTRQHARVAGLRCETKYEIRVAAADRRGPRSRWATLRTATLSCAPRSGGIPAPIEGLAATS